MTAAVHSRTPEELEQILAANAFPVQSSWREVASLETLLALQRERSRHLLTNPQTSIVAARQDSDIAGVACWTALDWDTQQFGFPAARLDVVCAEGDYARSHTVKSELVERVLGECRRRGVCHITARVDAGDFASIHALERAGFELIDGIQTFSLRLPAPDAGSSGQCEVRMYREGDLDQVLKIARSAYVYDRFHADSALSPEIADRVNEAWVRNSCLGRMADAVIVAADRDSVLGYVTCKIDAEATGALGAGCGVIGMVATAEAARSRGVASAATQGALEWFHRQGVVAVEVGTQLRNLPAGRLYERCGFRMVATSFTFRKWLGGRPANSFQETHRAI